MQRSGLFIHVANFLSLHLVKTTEWQAYRAIIESIRQGIVAKENYEKNFESSEFTAINIQEYTGDFKKAQLFCSDALSIAQSKDLITVIEVQGKGRSDRNLLNHIQDIITCLLDYEPKDCRQEYQTKKIFITVRTMRGQDLYAFEIVNDNIRKLKHLYDQMQKGFIRDIGEKISTFLTNYLTKSVNLFVTSFIMDKIQSNKPSSYRITDFNSDEFKSKILEDLKNEEFIELTIANVYKLIVGESEEEFNNGIFERLANKVLDTQTEMEFDHFNVKTIRFIIKNIYGAGVRNVLLNGLRLAIEDIIKHVRVTQSQYFAGGFRKYALWLSKKRITPGQCNHEDLLEEFCIEQGEETRTLPNFIGEFNVFEIKWIKSSSLLTLRPVCIDNHLRIVLNGKLTIDNINLFFSILSTFKQYSGNTNSQVIFLDLKKSLDLMWVFDKDGDLTLLEKNEQSSFDSQDFSIQKSTVITKKGGVSYAQMSAFDSNTTNATSELSALSRAYNLSRNKPITNDNQFYIAMKKVDVALSFEDDAKDNCFESHKTVKVSITSDLTSFFLTIKTFKDHRHIELTRKFVSHTNNKTKYVPCGLIHDGDEKFETIEVRYLPNFIRHLRSIQVLSASDDLEVFDYYRPASYVVDAVSFPVIGKSPAELDTMVLTKHLKIQNNIVEHFGKDMKTRVFSLKFSMSEFLTRKVYDKKWERLTKEFLLNSGLDVFVLEKAIDEFLLDYGVYLPTNDIEILGINTQRYRVEVTALVRDDRSTIIFLSRREFETDFEYCPLKKLLDIFCDVIKDPKYEFESHPFSYLLKTCYTEVHPIAYIFRCISDFRLTLHNTIDRDLEYDTNMEPVKQISCLVAECIFSEKLVPEISGTASTTAQNPETCYALSVKRILQAQVIYMIKLIKFQKRILASKTVFHLKILSLNNFDYEDELKIEALKYMITAVSE